MNFQRQSSLTQALFFSSRIAKRFVVGAALSFSSFAAFASTSIVFVGNSFTAGYPEVQDTFRQYGVSDLNKAGLAGVPAMFKAFTMRAGLDYSVSVEAVYGSNLDLHFNERMSVLGRSWDKVVLQGYSTLDADRPGDPAKIVHYSGLLANDLRAYNPKVEISLMATWARADQVYAINGWWYGKTVGTMAQDIQTAYELAKSSHPSGLISRVIPVGMAWNRAFERGIADANPYNGISSGQVNLWTGDNYHASRFGSYLRALTLLASITGVDPRTMGRSDPVAAEVGISAGQAASLQNVAYESTLGSTTKKGPARK